MISRATVDGFSRPFGTLSDDGSGPGSELPGYSQLSLRERENTGPKYPNSSKRPISRRPHSPLSPSCQTAGFLPSNLHETPFWSFPPTHRSLGAIHCPLQPADRWVDRKSTRLNSSH